MSKLLSNSAWDEHSSTEWMCIKISVAVVWVRTIALMAINQHQVPYPTGIFSLINGSFLASTHTIHVFLMFALALAALYVAERGMALITFLMFLVSLILFTLEESSGFLNRHYLYTAIFFAQFIAYYRNTPRLKEERIQFAVQIIAAGYVLAGISKLRQSGLGWITDAPLASIQILKGYCYTYFNTGNIKEFEQGMTQANFILQHKYLAEGLFASSLFLELFAWLSLRNKLTALIYGLLLFAMHIGINYFMNILIASIVFPMVIFMINPLYLVYLLLSKLFVKINPARVAGTKAA